MKYAEHIANESYLGFSTSKMVTVLINTITGLKVKNFRSTSDLFRGGFFAVVVSELLNEFLVLVWIAPGVFQIVILQNTIKKTGVESHYFNYRVTM